MTVSSTILSPQEWASLYRRDDGEQQPISPVEREFGLESQTRRHGLELMEPLMRELGDPQLRYPTVHVGGSKGKGSTVAILTAALRAAGYRVGSYTSPSLTHFGERIQVNGRSISDLEAEGHLGEIRRALGIFADRPRFFEAATATAFLHFARESVDIAVIEVGLGGGRDATNVVLPEVAIITSIELEHTQILGETLAAIAREKAGIIKPHKPTVTAVQASEPLGPILETCADRGSPVWRIGEHFRVEQLDAGPTWQRFSLREGSGSLATGMSQLTLGLAGAAQCTNAATAIVAAKLLGARFDRLSQEAMRAGLRDARWPGRLELRPGRPNVLLDVAHTPASARQLRHYLDRFFPDTPKTLVMGLLREKNAAQLAQILAPSFDAVLVAPVKWFRSMEPEILQAAFVCHGSAVQTGPSICAGVEWAMANTPSDGLVVVAGSVFAVGEAKRRFGWI